MTPLPLGLAELSALSAKCTATEDAAFLFCSTESGEGTSTLSYALAQRLAGAGRNVLYVDFNVQASYGAKVLHLPQNTWNLRDRIAEETYYRIPGRTLTLLSAPSGTAFGLEQCEPEIVRAAVSRWKSEFDIVIADAPPVERLNRTGLPTEILAAGFDATYIVGLSAVTPLVRIEKSVHRLQEAGAAIAGIILNDREMSDLRDELGRQFQKIADRFPKLATRLTNWVNARRVFDVEF